MLVISRRVKESIQIGNDIEITINQVKGDIVRVGINAPQKTQVWRKELWDAIVKENSRAAKGALSTLWLPVSVFSKLPRLNMLSVKNTKKRGKKGTRKSPEEQFMNEDFVVDAM
jgi:carbon storage regulator